VEWDIVIKEGFFIPEVSVCIRMYSHFQVGIPREPEIQLNGAYQAQFHIKSKRKQHKIKKNIKTSKIKLCPIG
jgi:hypothetical protein